jgi:hypothetical protein
MEEADAAAGAVPDYSVNRKSTSTSTTHTKT